METIFLDGRQYPDGLALHRALQSMLRLPPWYGCNADALYDCLSARTEPLTVRVLSMGEGDTAAAMARCIRAMQNLDNVSVFVSHKH